MVQMLSLDALLVEEARAVDSRNELCSLDSSNDFRLHRGRVRVGHGDLI